MELRPGFQIKTVIKAMTDVILPAVDPANKLALEQGQLVIGMLTLVMQSLPLLYRYDKDELSRFLTLAETLQSGTSDAAAMADVRRALAESAANGAEVLARALAEPSELETANLDLREKIGALVTAIYADSDAASHAVKQINSAVLAHAKDQLLRERAYVLMQGWEADPKSVPALETLIGTGPG
jgi:hypothetical protein